MILLCYTCIAKDAVGGLKWKPTTNEVDTCYVKTSL